MSLSVPGEESSSRVDCIERRYSSASTFARPIPLAGGAVAGNAPLVAILLGTYHGGQFLGRQLESIKAQTHSNWRIWASDDGGTIEELEAYRRAWGDDRLRVQNGPGKGFCANFLHLACDPSIDADYFAFCDQDDVWDPRKLETALGWIQRIPPETPALYCGRTKLIDEHDRHIGYSPLFSNPLSFRNALVQSIAGANTMVFNRATRSLLMETGPDIDVQTHDWWCYIVVSGCGGALIYDETPYVGYRQHEANQVGSNLGWPARWNRARRLLAGRFRSMNTRNIVALSRIRHRLSAEELVAFDTFCRARDAWLLPRAIGILRGRFHLQTRLGNLGLIAAVAFKRL